MPAKDFWTCHAPPIAAGAPQQNASPNTHTTTCRVPALHPRHHTLLPASGRNLRINSPTRPLGTTRPAISAHPTPSHKPPDVRKTQLHRQYQSLLRSSPLLLIFQHNNIKAVELMAIRRELAVALRKVDAARLKNEQETLSEEVKLQIVQTNIFASALRVVEFFHPESESLDGAHMPQASNAVEEERFTHGLSRHAHQVANNRKLKLELEPILSGPLAVVAFPSVAPQYLKAVLSILSPSKGDFPAPTRRANPDYYEPSVQQGLQKLMLLGARVEGKVFDVAGTKWVGGIDGGVDGLRAQLVHMLQSVGGSLASALEGASQSLYLTVEGRRMDMEEKEKAPEEKKD